MGWEEQYGSKLGVLTSFGSTCRFTLVFVMFSLKLITPHLQVTNLQSPVRLLGLISMFLHARAGIVWWSPGDAPSAPGSPSLLRAL